MMLRKGVGASSLGELHFFVYKISVLVIMNVFAQLRQSCHAIVAIDLYLTRSNNIDIFEVINL